MEGLFSFLLFAGFFYLMMRFGCGAHAIHGGPARPPQHTSQAVDPVCGKELNDDEGYGRMHDGTLYRFCSMTCLQTFEGNPERFIAKTAGAPDKTGGDL